jgi:hypothetical protein
MNVAWPLPNVWLGTSVENQATADERIPHLLKCPAAVRFLSCEPLLGDTNIRRFLHQPWLCEFCYAQHYGDLPNDWSLVLQSPICPSCLSRIEADGGIHVVKCGAYATAPDPRPWRSPIHWVIVGGESGRKARPMHPDWARSLRDQCKEAGVPFFFKQWGEYVPGIATSDGELVYFQPDKGCNYKPSSADLALLLDDLTMAERERISIRFFDNLHEFGDVAAIDAGCDAEGEPIPVVASLRVGKKAAGRLLDGVEHSEWPAVITERNAVPE